MLLFPLICATWLISCSAALSLCLDVSTVPTGFDGGMILVLGCGSKFRSLLKYNNGTKSTSDFTVGFGWSVSPWKSLSLSLSPPHTHRHRKDTHTQSQHTHFCNTNVWSGVSWQPGPQSLFKLSRHRRPVQRQPRLNLWSFVNKKNSINVFSSKNNDVL